MPPTRRTFLQTLAAAPLFAASVFAETPSTGPDDRRLVPFDKLMTEFLAKHEVSGASLAVARHGKIVYSRGFGYGHVESKTPVRPNSLFRIASVSKPFTAVAVLRLVERKKIGLDDLVFDHFKLAPHLEGNAKPDPRWKKVTVRHCLQHTGGWDRDKPGGFDPIGIPWKIGKALKVPPNVSPDDIVRYMLGQPLDFDPGTKYAYSNLGYLVLGRIIEHVTGAKYEAHLMNDVLGPLGITSMALGKALPGHRPKAEVAYYPHDKATIRCLYQPKVGEQVPWPDGGENTEAYEAHGGWVATGSDLVRFAASLRDPGQSPLLKADTIKTMFARPEGRPGHDAKGKPLETYYGCGWQVVDAGGGKINTFHTGYTAGVNSLLVRRHDGLDWAVLFNADMNAKGKSLTGLIDPRLHEAADAVKEWPAGG